MIVRRKIIARFNREIEGMRRIMAVRHIAWHIAWVNFVTIKWVLKPKTIYFEEKNDEIPSINAGKPTIAVNKGDIFRTGSNIIWDKFLSVFTQKPSQERDGSYSNKTDQENRAYMHHSEWAWEGSLNFPIILFLFILLHISIFFFCFKYYNDTLFFIIITTWRATGKIAPFNNFKRCLLSYLMFVSWNKECYAYLFCLHLCKNSFWPFYIKLFYIM